MNNLKKSVEGAQSVFRALDLLDLIAKHHGDGVDLASLVSETQLDRTTAYRLVSTLQQENLVERDPVTKRYRLGLESMQIGLTAMSRAPILEDCRPVMQAIAHETEDTVYLIVRNGDYSHCLHVEHGAFPIRTMMQHVGELRVLGLGAGGQALLATLPDSVVDGIYRRNERGYAHIGITHSQLLQRVAQIRHEGYAFTQNLITDGVSSIGLAFQIHHGDHAAISLACINARICAQRQIELVELLRQKIRELGFSPVMPHS